VEAGPTLKWLSIASSVRLNRAAPISLAEAEFNQALTPPPL
jgi:hypothetical protein